MHSINVRRLVLCLFTALVVACAAPQQLTEERESALLARAESRWRALEARDFGSAYDFLSPAYRSVFSRKMYTSKFSYMVEWELTSVELLNYDADAAVASVAVRVMSRSVKQTSAASEAIGAVPTRIVEQWILSDGEWWYSANL
jgi:hypothetical protein